MPNEGQMTLTVLHDLALLYLGLAYGADGELNPAETRSIAQKLREWQPHKDPALIDHVLREATLSYLNGAGTGRLQEVVVSLKDLLDNDTRASILNDLSDIAHVDGEVETSEKNFVNRVAEVWKVDHHPGSNS